MTEKNSTPITFPGKVIILSEPIDDENMGNSISICSSNATDD